MGKIIQKSFFILRFRFFNRITGTFRKLYYSFLGMKIGKNSFLPKLYVTWPNQVFIGNNCTLEREVYFKYDGIWKNGFSIVIGNNVFVGKGCEFNISKSIKIGDRCLIATGCHFIDHDHGIAGRQSIRGQSCTEKSIIIENDVWLGCNVIVLKGVTIGTGAVVAAGAVVTKSILPYEIWAGIPARKISERN